MTSSGNGGGRSPAPARAFMDDLLDLHERARMLQTMFDGGSSPTPPREAERELVEGMMSNVTRALSALNTSGGGGARRRKGSAALAGPIRRSSSSSSCRRRTLSPFLETVTTNTLDDGHAWRKYGQKRIQDSQKPRSYYRCTHMLDQGCKARKQVQVSDTNPSEYTVSYFGHHTCRDPSTIPLVIEADAMAPNSNFISFGSGATPTRAEAVPRRQEVAVVVDRTMTTLSRFAGCYSSSLPAAQGRCGSEEAISGLSPLGAAVAGSKGRTTTTASSSATVGSAPEYGMQLPGGGIDTGSFPSSPSSLGGFMATGSFGCFGDDDLFGFDP